jgi:K+-transporting ATPase ATPase A chain
LYLALLVMLGAPLGMYMARVYEGQSRLGNALFGPLERLVYRAARIPADVDMGWKRYAAALLLFNAAGALLVYGLERLQSVLPLNPAHMPSVGAAVAFNTAVSFVTNTNWQAYGGESTMSYLTQMAALTVQNFVSAATGMAVLVALIRGILDRCYAERDPHPAPAVCRARTAACIAGRGPDVLSLPGSEAAASVRGQ